MSSEHAARTVQQPVAVRAIVMVGVMFGTVAGVIDLVIYGVGRAIGVPFLVQGWVGGELALVPWYAVFGTCLAAGIVGGLLASLVRTIPSGPAWVMGVGLALGALSLLHPLLQPAEVGWATRTWLAVLHVVATLIIVPALSRGTTSEDPPPGALEALAR